MGVQSATTLSSSDVYYDLVFDQKCKIVLKKKETKNSGPSRQTCDQALGYGLTFSNLNRTVLLCARIQKIHE